MPYNKAEYDKEYAKAHITRKFIPFNDTVAEDVAILEHLATVGNVTAYVKRLIREDMRRTADAVIFNGVTYAAGYIDKDAIKRAETEGHAIRSERGGNLEVVVDVDAMTVLKVNFIC